MLILMPFNFAFIIFSIGEPQNSQIEKNDFFCQKTCKCGFLQIVDSGLLQLKQDVKEWRDFTLGPRVINQFLKSLRVVIEYSILILVFSLII